MTYWHLIIPPVVFVIALFFLMKFIAQKKREKKRNFSNDFVNRDIFQKKEGGVSYSETSDHLIIKIADSFEKIISSAFSLFLKKIELLIRFVFEKYTQYRENKNNLKVKNFTTKGREEISLMKEEKKNVSLRKEVEKKLLAEEKEKFFQEENQWGKKKEKDERPMVSEKISKEPRRVSLARDDVYETSLIERIALNPRDIEAYEMLGDYYIDRKNFTDAKDCYKQVLKLNPMSRGAKMRMRRLERVLAEDRNMV
ncbi:MAG: tetratricopeptide repeat protein [Candidatus Moranbacteria bacterium]|nr:tetratricopeptide repeat protein [Candidatus Moranbacteria bacterium]